MNNNYQSNLNVHPIQKFAHTSRFSFVCSACKTLLPPNASILDYGTADGYIPQLLISNIEGIKDIVAFDLVSTNFPDNINPKILLTTDKHLLNEKTYDLILCLETLEHVPEHMIDQVLLHLSDLTTENTYLLISVPIEIGLSSLVKNIVRLFSNQLENISSPINILYSSIGVTRFIRRSPNNPGHMGFNYKHLESKIDRYFNIISKSFTPFPLSRGVFNSQVYYVLKSIQ